MRVLVLESVSGIRREVDPKLFPEGFAMLRTMTNEFSDAGFDVVSTLNRKAKELAKWLDVDNLYDHDGLDKAIRSNPDAALVMAPEKGGELEHIVSKLREEGISVLGAEKRPINISGDKWLTYNILKERIPQPRTSVYPSKDDSELIKPRDGVGGGDVQVEPSGPFSASGNLLFQEFIEGEHVSCCLLMKEGKGEVLSVNKQEIMIRDGGLEYYGNSIPFTHEQEEACAETALKAAEILHMHGYCGVDLVLSEVPYFVELNPRPTTSFIGLARILQTNLGSLLVETIADDSDIPKPQLEGCSVIRIPKTKKKVKIETDELEELRKIPEVFAPPFATDGWLEEGAEVFVTVGTGNSFEKAEGKLKERAKEALERIGVEENAVAWP